MDNTNKFDVQNGSHSFDLCMGNKAERRKRRFLNPPDIFAEANGWTTHFFTNNGDKRYNFSTNTSNLSEANNSPSHIPSLVTTSTNNNGITSHPILAHTLSQLTQQKFIPHELNFPQIIQHQLEQAHIKRNRVNTNFLFSDISKISNLNCSAYDTHKTTNNIHQINGKNFFQVSSLPLSFQLNFNQSQPIFIDNINHGNDHQDYSHIQLPIDVPSPYENGVSNGDLISFNNNQNCDIIHQPFYSTGQTNIINNTPNTSVYNMDTNNNTNLTNQCVNGYNEIPNHQQYTIPTVIDLSAITNSLSLQDGNNRSVPYMNNQNSCKVSNLHNLSMPVTHINSISHPKLGYHSQFTNNQQIQSDESFNTQNINQNCSIPNSCEQALFEYNVSDDINKFYSNSNGNGAAEIEINNGMAMPTTVNNHLVTNDVDRVNDKPLHFIDNTNSRNTSHTQNNITNTNNFQQQSNQQNSSISSHLAFNNSPTSIYDVNYHDQRSKEVSTNVNQYQNDNIQIISSHNVPYLVINNSHYQTQHPHQLIINSNPSLHLNLFDENNININKKLIKKLFPVDIDTNVENLREYYNEFLLTDKSGLEYYISGLKKHYKKIICNFMLPNLHVELVDEFSFFMFHLLRKISLIDYNRFAIKNFIFTLSEQDTWMKFLPYGNELKMNRPGRSIFPRIIIWPSNLDLHFFYRFSLVFCPIQKNYDKKTNTCSYTIVTDPEKTVTAHHIDGVRSGIAWIRDGINFEYLKITNSNTQKDPTVFIVLQSSTKYIIKLQMDLYLEKNHVSTLSGNLFSTRFVSRTAYKSKNIIELKKQYNKYASGNRGLKQVNKFKNQEHVPLYQTEDNCHSCNEKCYPLSVSLSPSSVDLLTKQIFGQYERYLYYNSGNKSYVLDATKNDLLIHLLYLEDNIEYKTCSIFKKE